MDALRRAVVTLDGMQRLIELLAKEGYRVVGPTMRDQAIVYDDIASLADLPQGWTDRQEPGRYRLDRRADRAFFGFAVGPHSWKRFLHPPVEALWTARRGEGGPIIESSGGRPPRYAFIGVRACELHAIAIQDKVFLGGPWQDSGYGERRRDAFIVAVNCAEAGGTCFCVSMEAGPQARTGFDLAVTELIADERHEFFIEAGSDEGEALLIQLPHRDASDADIEAVEALVARTANSMGRHLETDGLKEILQGNPNHPRWEQVAERCLTCGNCTMVCPTCFCTTVEDHTDLALSSATRVRKWDSCFTMDFSFIHGGSVRSSARARYRQWMTHKLAHWIDQFGSSGCVGCGRCITWCPVGIDITQEAAAIRAAQQPMPEKAS